MNASHTVNRPPMLAGTWYPGSKERLAGEVARYCGAADPVSLEGPPVALIVPHAGYTYSGSCAGQGYRTLEGARVRRAIVIGPSHRDAFAGVALSDAAAFETPLGAVALDRRAIARLRDLEPFCVRAEAHAAEHCIEIQLPFLQHVLGAGVGIVPMLVGRIDETGKRLAAAGLRAILDPETLVVVSSDFTHYGSSFGYLPFAPDGNVRGGLEELDGRALDTIVRRDIELFAHHCEKEAATICGAVPIEIMLRAFEGMDVQARLLRYDTSGDRTGDWSQCVAYASVVFEDRLCIDAAAARLLSVVARDAIGRAVGLPVDEGGPREALPACLLRPAGAFVTIKKAGALRGCIGHLQSHRPLHEVVARAAVSAATGDPRFPSLRAGEFPRLDIEVSVLSESVELHDIREIVIGRDGLIAEAGAARGTLLPQVAIEHGLDREAFVAATLRKAGIPREAADRGDVRLWRYQARVIRAG